MSAIRPRTLCALALTAVVAAASAVRAGGFDPSDLDPFKRGSDANNALNNLDQQRLNAMSPDPRPGRDYTKVFIKNNTQQTISVAVDLMPFTPPNVTVISDPGDNGFRLQAWYNLAPGATAYVGDTSNTFIYFYGQGPNMQWAGKTIYKNVRDGAKTRQIGMFQEAIIGMPPEYTMEFNQ